MDPPYIEKLKNRMKEIKQQKEDAEELGNDERIAKLEEEIRIIEKQCLTYVKQNGKSYEFIDSNQKVKKDTIRKGIERCIEKIKEESKKAGCNNLSIRKHLDESIKLEGGNVFYMPKKQTTWN